MSYQLVSQSLGLKKTIRTPLDLVKMVREGIPKKAIETLAQNLHVSISKLTELLPISERSLQRYPSEKVLSSGLTDHLFQIAKVYIRCIEVFEDRKDATSWLQQTNLSLGNIAPLELLDTSTGIEMILDELIRIEYGVFS